MRPRFHQFRLYRRLKILFFSSLICFLYFHYIPVSNSWLHLTAPAQAQTLSVDQRVQQGGSHYQNGELQTAIEYWHQALGDMLPDATDEKGIVLQYLANAYRQIGNERQAIVQLDQAIATYQQTHNTLQVGRLLTAQADAYSAIGQHRRAIALLCEVEKADSEEQCSVASALGIARAQKDVLGQAAALGTLGNTYRLQGRYEQAIQAFTTSLEMAAQLNQVSYQAAALNGLGNVYASLARRSHRYAQLANQSNDQRASERFQQATHQHNQKAIVYYERSLESTLAQGDRLSELQTRLNLIEAYYQQSQTDMVDRLHPMIQAVNGTVQQVPNSRTKVYAMIRLANLTRQMFWGTAAIEVNPATQCPESVVGSEGASSAISLLHQARDIAQGLEDLQSVSLVLGQLGHIYECQQDYDQALDLTQQAQLIAVSQESQYLWAWQTGRIFKTMGQKHAAIAAYEQAVAHLDNIRGDIAIANRELQLDFRDTVESVYRQLTELKLTDTPMTLPSMPIQDNLLAVLETLDKLRLTELQNYLGDECELTVVESPITQIDERTAVLSSIIFADRTAIIATIPDGQGEFNSVVHWIPLDQTKMVNRVNEFRRHLERRSDRQNQFKRDARQFYDWLIRPFTKELTAAQINTLVFLQDGILRSLPMSVLLDGDHFLVEHYALANASSLALTRPTPLNSSELRVLAFGLTEAATTTEFTSFPALHAVAAELEGIEATVPRSQGFLNQDFSRDRLQQELNRNAYSALHLATHAQFGFDAADTFLVTGNRVTTDNVDSVSNWGADNASIVPSASRSTLSAASDHVGNAVPADGFNETLAMSDLYRILRQTQQNRSPLALLTLTACETAVGSDRDALGIAGIALQAGAQSAVASLWQVDDAATAQIITDFYRALGEGMSRATALQTAQKNWLTTHPSGSYRHPGYWAAFILIGNWL